MEVQTPVQHEMVFSTSRKNSVNLVLPVPQDLDTLVKGLRIIFEQDHVNVEILEKYLKQYKSKPADWKKFAKFDAHK